MFSGLKRKRKRTTTATTKKTSQTIKERNLDAPPKMATTMMTTTSTTKKKKKLPVDPTQWGLNPLYWSYLRLTCYQVNECLSTLPSLENAHVLHGTHSVTKVELVGIVVRVVSIPSSMDKYTLDDGTGLVDCTKWMTQFEKKRDRLGLRPMEFCLGDMVRVRGRLKRVPDQTLARYICFSTREVSVKSMTFVESKHEEIHHRLLCQRLYRDAYADRGGGNVEEEGENSERSLPLPPSLPPSLSSSSSSSSSSKR